MSVLLLILGLVFFIMLVVVHELGHFWVAKRNGVKAEEFGIFFPPRLWSRKTKNGWDFSINALPLGGFVRLKGEHDADKVKGGYGAARLRVKVKILLAGVGMNLVVAFILFMVLAWIGMPQLVTKDTVGTNQFTVASDSKTIKNEVLIADIEGNSPAAKAGLKADDQLLSINLGKNNSQQNAINSADHLSAFTKQYAGQAVALTIKRGSVVETLNTTLRTKKQVTAANSKAACVKNGNGCIGYLGAVPLNFTLKRSTWSAPIVAGGLIWQFTDLTVHGLISAAAGLGRAAAGLVSGNTTARQAGQQQAAVFVGPIGIYAVLKDSTTRGYQLVLMIIALISLSFALVNLLPIPALDGGKLYATLISNLVFHKKVSAAVENWLYGLSYALIIMLFVLISISDVHHFY